MDLSAFVALIVQLWGVIACFGRWILGDGGESGFDGIAVSGVEVENNRIPWNSLDDINWMQWAQLNQVFFSTQQNTLVVRWMKLVKVMVVFNLSLMLLM